MKDIDDAVRNILRVKLPHGSLRQDGDTAGDESGLLDAEALDVAKRLATESLVLLKNEGVLPLAKNAGKVAVIGPLADSPVDQMGSWVMDGRKEDVRTPLAALRAGCSATIASPTSAALKNSRDMSHDAFAAAVEAANGADFVLLFLGEEQILSGEAHSRAFLNLPGAQEALVDELAKTGKPMIAVIMAGRPLTFQSDHGQGQGCALCLAPRHHGRAGHRRRAIRRCVAVGQADRSRSRAPSARCRSTTRI